MRNLILTLAIVCLAYTLAPTQASATSLWFDPVQQFYDIGDTIAIELHAEIDSIDAIFGFGFDLSFDGGTSYISGPEESGSYLTFTGFTPYSTYFQYDTMFPPLWADNDTIAGEVPLGNDCVWGTDILFGTFYFDAPSSGFIGVENIYLGPSEGNYGIFGEKGLLASTAIMPNNPTASAAPIPMPTTFVLLLTSGLIGLACFKKKFKKG